MFKRTPLPLFFAFFLLAACSDEHPGVSVSTMDAAVSGGGVAGMSPGSIESSPEFALPQIGPDAPKRGGLARNMIAQIASGAPVSSAAANAATIPGQTPKFAYSHQLSISLPPAFVKPRFQAARDACLEEKALRCVLVDASIDGDSGVVTPFRSDLRFRAQSSAHLQARLPHDAVAGFRRRILDPATGEQSGDARLLRDATQMEDLSAPIADMDRRLESLEIYRKRLEEIAQRKDSRVEDLIRVANEIGEAQSRIEAIEASRRNLDRRVEMETVNVFYQADNPPEGPASPLYDVWRRSLAIMASSAAVALVFVLRLLPWIPVLILAGGALVGAVRLFRSRFSR